MKKKHGKSCKRLERQVQELATRLAYAESVLQITIQRICEIEAERVREQVKAQAEADTLPY